MDEHALITIRPARITDSHVIAELAMIAGEGIPAFFWQQDALPGQDLLEVGANNAASDCENFSYRNTTLLDIDDRIAAMLLAYPLADTPDPEELTRLPAAIRGLIELEHRVPGTFYLNMLATLPEYRNRSLGSRLLKHAHKLARKAGCNTLSIMVFSQNTGALRLYLRTGFKEIARLPVIPHPCHPYTEDIVLLTQAIEAP